MRTSTLLALDRYVGGLLLLAAKPFVILTGLILRPNHSLEPQGDILVLKFLGAGSLFIALPNLLGLRKRYPHRKIMLLTTTGVADFVRPLALFDKIYVIDSRNLVCLVQSSLDVLMHLVRIDTVIDLEVYSRAATFFAVFLRARNRLAFFIDEPFWKRRIATHLLFFSKATAVHEYYDQLFGLLDAKPASMADVRDYLLKDKRASSEKLEKHICIGHACSDNAPERQLSAQSWANVLSSRFTRDQVLTIEMLGGKSDRASAENIAATIRAVLPAAQVINSCGIYAPQQVITALEKADEFWGIDSLLLHVARCLGKPTVSFWGPSAPVTRLRDITSEDQIHYEPIICSPCVHSAIVAPCRGNNICIQRITGIESAFHQEPTWLIS